MLTIRLQRRGRKNDPSFRVILVEKKRAAKTGQFMEVLGSYDARTGRTALQGDRIKEWMSKGVTISDNLHNLLVSNNIIEGKKINILPRKSPPKAESEEAPTAPSPQVETQSESVKAEVKEEKETGDNAVEAETEAK